jgi:hypothetical protein
VTDGRYVERFEERHPFRVLGAKSVSSESPVIALIVTPILRQREWVVDAMGLPDGDAVGQTFEQPREDGTGLDVFAAVGVQSGEKECGVFRFAPWDGRVANARLSPSLGCT